MKRSNFRFYMHYRADPAESIEDRHRQISEGMLQLPPPFGWREVSIPPAPDCGDELGASFWIKYPTPGLQLEGRYVYRGSTYRYQDQVFYDDKVWISFSAAGGRINYREMLLEHLASAMAAFRGNAGHGYLASHSRHFSELHAAEIHELRKDSAIDVNGRNNIFTLNVVQYWDAELCQRALGYGRDEVIKRLTGKVPLVQPLMDGVYVVFNDNPDLTFDEFCAYNDTLKPVLGLQ